VRVFAVYIVEQNVKVSSSYVSHRLYLTHKKKKNILKPIGKSRENQWRIRLWSHPCTTLLGPYFEGHS